MFFLSAILKLQMISLPDNQVKQMLVSAGILDEKTFDIVKTEAVRKNQNPLDILISEGAFTRDSFWRARFHRRYSRWRHRLHTFGGR